MRSVQVLARCRRIIRRGLPHRVRHVPRIRHVHRVHRVHRA
jgi:hypothetical protein